MKILYVIYFLIATNLFAINYFDKYDQQYKEYNLTVEYENHVIECSIDIFHFLFYYTIDFEINKTLEGHSIFAYTIYKIDNQEFELKYDLLNRRAYELEDKDIDDVTIKKIEFVDSNNNVYYTVLNHAIYHRVGD